MGRGADTLLGTSDVPLAGYQARLDQSMRVRCELD